jgi:autotransporter-associated beta strand protein
VTTTYWTLSNSGAANSGGIKANGFVLNTSGVTTDVGAGMVLTATGGNNVANNLGGTGTINSSSIFRYSGTAASGTPSTLTYNRNIGDIEVTAGALRLLSNSVGTAQNLRVSGTGTFDLQGGTNTFTSISLTGGTLANGSYQTAAASFTNLQTGTVSGSLVSTNNTQKLIKNTAGTLTLSGFNSFANAALEVSAGTVAITTANALNGVGVLDMKGGTLDLGGQSVNKYINTLTNGSVITNGSILRTSASSWTLQDGTIAANLTASGAGSISITKNGTGVLLLSGANTASGTHTISAGTLAITNGSAIADDGVITNGASGIFRVDQSETIGSLRGAGNVNLNGSGVNLTVAEAGTNTFSGVFSNTGSLTKGGEGSLTLSGTNLHSGGVTLSGGRLRLNSTSALGSGSLTQTSGASTLEINTTGTITNQMSIYNVSTLQSVTLSGNKTLNNATYDVAASTTTTESGALSGSGGITKNGAGTLVVSGTTTNSFTGGSVVNDGTLKLEKSGGATAISGSSIAVNSGGTLLLGAANQIGDSTTITLSGGTLNTAGYAEAAGQLTVSANSTIQGMNSTSGADFTFSDIDLGNYSTSSGSTLTFLNSGGTSYGLGTIIQLSTVAASSWTGYSETSLNNFSSKISFSDANLMAQINFGGGTSGTTLTVAAIPEPRVYAAAAGLVLLIGWAEFKRRRGTRAKRA